MKFQATCTSIALYGPDKVYQCVFVVDPTDAASAQDSWLNREIVLMCKKPMYEVGKVYTVVLTVE